MEKDEKTEIRKINAWVKSQISPKINSQVGFITLIKFGLLSLKSNPDYNQLQDERAFYPLSTEMLSSFSKDEVEIYVPFVQELTAKHNRRLKRGYWLSIYGCWLAILTLPLFFGRIQELTFTDYLAFIIFFGCILGSLFMQSIISFNCRKLAIVEAICNRALQENSDN